MKLSLHAKINVCENYAMIHKVENRQYWLNYTLMLFLLKCQMCLPNMHGIAMTINGCTDFGRRVELLSLY